jgi:phosphatidylglycerol:prolipoprotein diacylglycerol transferase
MSLSNGARGEGAKLGFWQWADLIAPGLALGQAIGRWGNYFNQENFGWPTNLPWGIPIDVINRPLAYLNFQYFQPTFLYESGLDVVNFGVLVGLFWWIKNREQKSENRNQSKGIGLIFLVYLVNYSLIRIGMEFLRVDVTPMVWGVRWPIWVSGAVAILALVGLIWKMQAGKKQKT